MDILGIDHVEFYVGDATQAAFFLCTAFGFDVVGHGRPETGLDAQRTLLLSHGDSNVLLTSALNADHPADGFVSRHSDGVAVIAFTVDDAEAAYQEAMKAGAADVEPPQVFKHKEDAALLPTDAEVQAYAEHGWHLTGKLFSDEEIDALVQAVDRYYAGQRSRTLPVRPPKLAAWKPSDGPVQRHNDYVHYESDPIARILCKPLIGAVAARLAQADEIRVFQSTLIYKPPVVGEPSNVVPWHFDRHYWAACSSEQMLTAFIPFHDCDEEMGTITMVDGSHTWEEVGRDDTMVQHFAERDRADLERVLTKNAAHNGAEIHKIPMAIPKGHMSFRHCRLYHGSGANLSPRPRQAISFHLQDGANEFQHYELGDGSFASRFCLRRLGLCLRRFRLGLHRKRPCLIPPAVPPRSPPLCIARSA